MTKKTERTRPLDRDGDGQDGGSLPGNQTAPMAKVIVTAPWDDTATPDQVKAKTEEAARAAWGDKPFTVTMKGDKAVATLDDADAQSSSDDASPSDDASEASDTEAVGAASEASDDADPVTDTDGEATFTAEEIAAGQTPVVEQEGEATATAADQATQLDDADPLATVETDKAPIAVRLSDLQKLTSARRLYHTREGYSATWNAPFLDEATVDGWVAAGLAEPLPTAGNTGGVRATDEARKLERQLRRDQAQAA